MGGLAGLDARKLNNLNTLITYFIQDFEGPTCLSACFSFIIFTKITDGCKQCADVLDCFRFFPVTKHLGSIKTVSPLSPEKVSMIGHVANSY